MNKEKINTDDLPEHDTEMDERKASELAYKFLSIVKEEPSTLYEKFKRAQRFDAVMREIVAGIKTDDKE